MMKGLKGFTLVELLVVIAIISILAAIVLPRVQAAIERARVTRAAAEARSAETAVTAMLADAGKKKLSDLFERWNPDDSSDDSWYEVFEALGIEDDANAFVASGTNPGNITTAEIDKFKKAEFLYTQIMYNLLRKGRAVDAFEILGSPAAWEKEFGDDFGVGSDLSLPFADGVKGKLQDSYMDMGLDPWGTNQYRFFFGPWKIKDGAGENLPIFYRCYRYSDADNDGTPDQYRYDDGAKAEADKIVPGNPKADNYYGYPAPKDLPVYVYSYGSNQEPNQNGTDDVHDGGDDVNNWDQEQGWSEYSGEEDETS